MTSPATTLPELASLGFRKLRNIYWQPNTEIIYEEAIRRDEGLIASEGPLIVYTGEHTGRSPKDKYVVREPSSENDIWWGSVNQPVETEQFERMLDKTLHYFENRDMFVQNVFAGADPDYRIRVRVITEMAWHSLFARNLFITPKDEDLVDFEPDWTIIQAPNHRAMPDKDNTRTHTFIYMSFERQLILIGGSHYTGEIKKGIFTVLNYILPKQGVLSMHCSANDGDDGDVALFFGLSGTGKTTLSSDARRHLIGDDEHGWDDDGVFNFEGGCYAKVIDLSADGEPEIYGTTTMYGTILENVGVDTVTRKVDLTDDSYTPNTRAAYPISYIPNHKSSGQGRHPRNILFLTADAFGVMPPVSKLTREQAMYHFLSGYTAKVAGTESGMSDEPQATFSACFGAPFLPIHPAIYADLLGEKIDRHDVDVWLVNTGWTGGPYGTGHRISLAHTRAMVNAILDGALTNTETWQEPFFGLHIPKQVSGVPDEVLNPRATWTDPLAYDQQARELIALFEANFEKYADGTSAEIIAAGPAGG